MSGQVNHNGGSCCHGRPCRAHTRRGARRWQQPFQLAGTALQALPLGLLLLPQGARLGQYQAEGAAGALGHVRHLRPGQQVAAVGC